ncbi:MAG: hypothetical protein M1816_008143 [Peltula sp. TS41687]|nr:MAG: hypothetical protein M1816_008143 [Peltula sp. TS41687]
MPSADAPFVKQLAGSDRATRDKALSSLRAYLSGRRTFDELQLLKLWKGLFYCLWMSDKPRTQQRLVVDLASLIDVLPEGNVLLFLQAFWKTMVREWNGIDVLRMDKYLLLVRAYLAASFSFLARLDWQASLVDQYVNLLASIPLNPTDGKVPDGMRYHLLDIYVDELDKADTPRTGKLPLDSLLGPLRTLKQKSPTKAVRLRAADTLNDERLGAWSGSSETKGVEDQGDENEVEEWNGLES